MNSLVSEMKATFVVHMSSTFQQSWSTCWHRNIHRFLDIGHEGCELLNGLKFISAQTNVQFKKHATATFLGGGLLSGPVKGIESNH